MIFMFCTNCGNRTDENAYVCVNCGVILKGRSVHVISKKESNTNVLGIISIIFGGLAMLFSIMLFFSNIFSVGMYTQVYDRIFYTLDYSLFAILLSSVLLILALISKKNIYNKYGLCLSILSLFFIITEFIVVIIY